MDFNELKRLNEGGWMQDQQRANKERDRAYRAKDVDKLNWYLKGAWSYFSSTGIYGKIDEFRKAGIDDKTIEKALTKNKDVFTRIGMEYLKTGKRN